MPIEPELFRARYHVDADVTILGPYAGTLQDSGERLELERPMEPEQGVIGYEVVDRVRYNDKAPWPPAADGSGPSLQKLTPGLYGNDPVDWTAASPTPGRGYEAGALPVIVEQPQSRTVVASQATSFSVRAEGSGSLFYQWRWNGEPLTGETNAVLNLPKVQPTQAGFYGVVVFNGGGVRESAEAELKVLIPARITQEPQGKNVRPGVSVTFSVRAQSSTAITYQWRLGGVAIPGATGQDLILANVQPAHEGFYTVMVTDSVGTIESQAARLLLLFNPVYLEQPQSQRAVEGDTVSLSVALSGTQPMGYRWRKNGTTLVPFGQGTATLTLSNVTLASAGTYSVIATNAASLTGVFSTNAVLTVLTDADHDHLPDEWEVAYGLNPNDPTDALLDLDGDTMNNWQEYLAGTNPTNALSYLKVERLVTGVAGAQLEFLAVSNKTYTLQYKNLLSEPAWLRLLDVGARETNRVEAVIDPAPAARARFYRLVTPKVK